MSKIDRLRVDYRFRLQRIDVRLKIRQEPSDYAHIIEYDSMSVLLIVCIMMIMQWRIQEISDGGEGLE